MNEGKGRVKQVINETRWQAQHGAGVAHAAPVLSREGIQHSDSHILEIPNAARNQCQIVAQGGCADPSGGLGALVRDMQRGTEAGGGFIQNCPRWLEIISVLMAHRKCLMAYNLRDEQIRMVCALDYVRKFTKAGALCRNLKIRFLNIYFHLPNGWLTSEVSWHFADFGYLPPISPRYLFLSPVPLVLGEGSLVQWLRYEEPQNSA